ncbi:calcitonin gene-related peptide type 1 receptor [Ixodes scapularis]
MAKSVQSKKAVRAVIILFPLFGTQFLLGVYRKPQLCGAWEVYQYFNRTTDALQGCFVALLFCYLSGEAWCKLLIIGWRYFRLAQYHWMFCEAFYLNRLITTAFAEQKSVLLYYSVGWGFPAVFLATYAVFRAKHGDTKCWIEPLDHYEWIVLFPGLLCLILNFVFLCNIIRILVTKLRTAHTNEPLQFRKAVRAVIILFPLFGTQFLLGVYRKPQLCGAWEVYQYFNRTTDALQGCFVALLFCYLSGEVQTHVARSFDRVKLRYKIARESSLRRSTRTSIRMYAFGNSQDPNVSLQAQDARL